MLYQLEERKIFFQRKGGDGADFGLKKLVRINVAEMTVLENLSSRDVHWTMFRLTYEINIRRRLVHNVQRKIMIGKPEPN